MTPRNVMALLESMMVSSVNALDQAKRTIEALANELEKKEKGYEHILQTQRAEIEALKAKLSRKRVRP